MVPQLEAAPTIPGAPKPLAFHSQLSYFFLMLRWREGGAMTQTPLSCPDRKSGTLELGGQLHLTSTQSPAAHSR